jgi:hypothetical protein
MAVISLGKGFAAALMLALFQNSIASNPPQPKSSEDDIVGTWSWRVPSAVPCIETITFRADGTRSVVSGNERADSTYTIEAVPFSVFRKLNVKIVKDHGGVDCGGDATDDTGGGFSTYFVIQADRSSVLFCEKPRFDACIGPYLRVRAP